MADIDYKIFGLLAVCILTAGLAFVVIKWPKSVHATFSQHVAARKQSIIYYAVLFGIVLTLLVMFFLNWFVPTFQISAWFSLFVITSCIAQFLCTLIPEVGGRRSTYHRFFAGLSGVLLVPALALLLASENVDDHSKVLVSLALSAMLFVVMVVAIRKGEPRYFLLLQVAYFTAFFIPILAIAYL